MHSSTLQVVKQISGEYAQRERKRITQAELCSIIINLYEQSQPGDSKKYDWMNLLDDAGYTQELYAINFLEIATQLKLKYGAISDRIISFVSQFECTGVIFNACVNIWQMKKTKIMDCRFLQCTLGGFKGCRLNGCQFIGCCLTESRMIRCMLTNTHFEGCRFSKAIFCLSSLNQIKMIKCSILNSQFYNLATFNQLNEMQECFVDGKSVFQNTPFDVRCCEYIKVDYSNTNIVVLYSPADGTANCELLISFFESKHVNVILLSPQTGLEHPIFQCLDSISGMVLPGGPDVPEKADIRKTFEMDLLAMSRSYRIPLLGVCRGHQLIGSLFGGKIKRHSHEFDGETDIIVSHALGSMLEEIVHHKYNKYHGKHDSRNMLVTIDAKGRYVYQSQCAHANGVFFDKGRSNKHEVIITAKSNDGLVEGLQIDGHIFTFQHHHEAYADQYPELGQVARGVLNGFVRQVKIRKNMLDLVSAECSADFSLTPA